jgi:hypothetical protein
MNEDQLEREKRAADHAWKYVMGCAIALSIMALPTSRFQDMLKMGVWTTILLGFIVVYAWPFVIDVIAVLVIGAIAIGHFTVMWFAYPRIPHHGYIAIGLVTACEFVVCLLPIAWLDARSETRRIERGLQS